MEQITIEATAQAMVSQLEDILGKIAVASQAGLSTYYLEPLAQKTAAKLKTMAETLKGLPLWKDVNTGKEIYGSEIHKLPAHIFMAYASLSKRCKDTDMDVFKDEEKYFVKLNDNLFVNLDDLPREEMPKFKVKLEGDTLMAIRTDMYNQLPDKMKKLLDNKKGEE